MPAGDAETMESVYASAGLVSVVAVQSFRDRVYWPPLAPAPVMVAKLGMAMRAAMVIGKGRDDSDARPTIGVIRRNHHAGAEAAGQDEGKGEAGELFHGISNDKDRYVH